MIFKIKVYINKYCKKINYYIMKLEIESLAIIYDK